MNKNRLLAAVLLAAAVLLPTKVSAAPLVSLVPSFQAGSIGDTFSVNIVVSDLGTLAVGSYDLDILFDASILSAGTITYGSGLGGSSDAINLSGGFGAGVIDLAIVSLLDASTLFSLQNGGPFTLATLTFQGAANGTSLLTFTQTIFADGDGIDLPVDVENGSIQVGTTPIPEPGTLLLLGSGAAVAALRKRRQMRRNAA